MKVYKQFGIFQLVVQSLVSGIYEVNDWPCVSVIYDQCFYPHVIILKTKQEKKVFCIREYENFFENISPYIDDELCYEDSINFRKYLLKSKSARSELASAYSLKNNIKISINEFKDKLNINYSNKIIRELQGKNFNIIESFYKNVAIFIGFLISTLILISVYLGFSYLNEAFAEETDNSIIKTIEIPNENEMIEFTFDENNNPLIIAK